MQTQSKFDSRRIGKYEVTGVIGEGGFGRVVRAWDSTIRREVAIKLLKTGEDASLLIRFRAEAATTANLRHPNIVTLHEFGEHEGVPYIVMEFLDGKDLREVIRSGEYIPLSGKVRILSQAAQGFQAAHSQGIVHRDIKPANIMLLRDGTVKVMDFGIARIAGERSTRLTQVGFQVGTLFYMAPEQFAGRDADPMTEVFSFGVTMYEFLSGEYPFRADTDASLMYQIGNETPRPLDVLVPNCPAGLVEVVARALQRDRNQRYPSMEDLELDLRPILTELDRADAAQLLTRIPLLLSQDNLDEAETIVRRSLLMDPANAEAKSLRESIRQRKQAAVVDTKVRDLVARAERQQDQGALAEAVITLEEARKLAPNDTDLGRRLEKVREIVRVKENSRRLLGAAQQLVQHKEYQAARDQLELAVLQDPTNSAANELLNWLYKTLEQERRDIDIQEQITLAKSHAASADYESAIRVLEDAARRFPEASAIQSLLGATRADQQAAARQHILRVGFERVDALIAAGDFAGARTALIQMRERIPGDVQVERRLKELELRTRPTPAPRPREAPIPNIMPVPPAAPVKPAPVEPPSPPPAVVYPPAAASAPREFSRAILGVASLIMVAGLFATWWAFKRSSAGESAGSGTPAAYHLRATPESLSFRGRINDRTAQNQVLAFESEPGGPTPHFRIEPAVPWLQLGQWDGAKRRIGVQAHPSAAIEGLHSTTILIAANSTGSPVAVRVPVQLTVEAVVTPPAQQAAPAPPPGQTTGAKGATVTPVKSRGEPSPPLVARTEVRQPPPSASGSTPTREPEPPQPPGRYLGNPVGSVSWSGELAPGATLVIEKDRVSQGPGRITGFLPGVAVRFRRVVPGTDRLALEETPSASDRFSRIRLRNVSAESVTFIRLDWIVVE